MTPMNAQTVAPGSIRRSPIAQWHDSYAQTWLEREGMALPATFHRPPAVQVLLQDVSWHRRFGCKGPRAEAWLNSLGFPPSPHANRCVLLDPGILVARLATAEFLVEAIGGSAAQDAVARCAGVSVPAGVYPVPRQDFAFVLSGQHDLDLLLQVCSYDFSKHATAGSDWPVVFTVMAEVGVAVIPQTSASGTSHRIWCDPSYAPYLWSTLIGIAEEMGGGAVPG